ncbi:RraA family protein [Bacillus subtilis]|uniref:RraA family protein n=1 Tax=Bacillus subtilis TaxID=1423 RepID=UPI00203D85BC|nr:RraA family protein [Bacillus subtilis]MCM3013808.1 RraA family protein [Bacillus subtilis]MCM3523527.1 RraA family protein [Bacillus subtilis]
MNKSYRERLEKLSTTNVSDALDALGLKGATYGITPTWEGCKKIMGEAVTVKIVPAGVTKSPHHLGVNAIEAAQEGDIILIDNGGRLDVSCWGGILANGAKANGISGVVIDGACRDVDDYAEADFSVYARGAVVATARGRITEEATNVIVQFGGVQVRPKDIVIGDRSGVVIIPQEKTDDVLKKAEALLQKEEAMIQEIRNGASMLEVDTKYHYEKMIE